MSLTNARCLTLFDTLTSFYWPRGFIHRLLSFINGCKYARTPRRAKDKERDKIVTEAEEAFHN